MAYMRSELMGPYRRPSRRKVSRAMRPFPMPWQSPPPVDWRFTPANDVDPYSTDTMGMGGGPDGMPRPSWQEGVLNHGALADLIGSPPMADVSGPFRPPQRDFNPAVMDMVRNLRRPQPREFDPQMILQGRQLPGRPQRQVPPNFMDLVRQFAGMRGNQPPQGRMMRF